ncbi:MAG: hypothetical protein J1F02_08910 [Lachnospiraceae bacterium]|nr:hypothetical protein [Lachnospiraceae bacterium]
MRIIRSFLAAAITLSLVAGYSGVQNEKTIVTDAKTKKITIKAASDFTIKLPAKWKNNYVMKSSKKIKNGSLVSFHSKKCYEETKDGWLFSIARYKDDSYQDMPNYEVVGKWNGFEYVALFPSDIQTFGVSKAAKKQYNKLNPGSYGAALSIQPVKKVRKGKGVFRASDFSLKLPDSWEGNYIVKQSKKKKHGSYVTFYAKECYKQTKEGCLFSIGRYKDDSYQELPDYEVVGQWNGFYYVADFPTDVQSEGATDEAKKQFGKLNKSVEKVVRSIWP